MGKDSVSDVEKSDEASDVPLKRDTHGLPLVPPPSDFTDDPLVSELPSFCTNPQGCSSLAELAPMEEMDCPATGQLHGLSRPLQRCCTQPRLRGTGQGLP